MIQAIPHRTAPTPSHAIPASQADVTVIIPTHQRPELLRRALASVVRQTYRKLEVIVVSDGDDCGETQAVVAEFSDPRLHLAPLWVRRGAAQARNIGVRLATTPWIALLDDDDEWMPEKLALQMEAARAARVPFPVVSCRSVVRGSTFAWISPEHVLRPGEAISEFLFCRRRLVDGARYMQTSSLLMPRELMLTLPFRPHLRRHQDWDWLLRAAGQPGVSFHMMPQALSVFHVEDGRTSVGRGQDWEFSRAWATEMRRSFTPRAYSFFLATECASRAAKSRAGWKVYTEIARESVAYGKPTARSLLLLAGFLLIPHTARQWLRRRARGLQTRTSHPPATHAFPT
ncbi:glycosyltransferase family 2 protein [Silvibacterium sp.]|uniref:glycosyltransferase family 2 protein n=1 Tax=Silvibacterium sp. TaxID=1964179 RepID=UPI0039E45FCB